MSVRVQIQYKEQRWHTDVSTDQIRAADFDAVQQRLRQTAPQAVKLPARLHMTSFTGATWTPANIRLLADEGYVGIEAPGARASDSQHKASHSHE